MRRNSERPGLGFASHPKPVPPPAKKGFNPSIFGVISSVNQGVSKTEKKVEETEVNEPLATARAIADRINITSDVQKSQHLAEKRSKFLLAKSNVEKIFQTGTVPPHSQPLPPPTTTQGNIFKVPEIKVAEKATAKTSTERPGLGFADDKKSFPKVAVGVGRNVFSEEENARKSGKFSLVPYEYDDKNESESTNSKHSDSKSKKGRRFTEEKKKSDSKKTDSSKKDSKRDECKIETVSSSSHEEEYFKYGFKKDDSVPSIPNEKVSSSSSSSKDKRKDKQSITYQQYQVGQIQDIAVINDLSSRNDNDIVRFMNEQNPMVQDRGYIGNPPPSFPAPQLPVIPVNNVMFNPNLPPPSMASVQPSNLAPIQPGFVAFPLPLDPNMTPMVNPEFQDEYREDRSRYETDQYRDGGDGSYAWRSPPRDTFDNYDERQGNGSWHRNDSDYGYDNQYDDDMYLGGSSRSDSYNRSPGRYDDFQERFYHQDSPMSRDGYHYEPRYADTVSRSPSPGRYNRDRRSGSLERSRGRHGTILLEDRPLGYPDRKSLERDKRSRERDRKRDRSLDRDRRHSLDRDRARRRSLDRTRDRTARSRSRGRRSLSRGRADNQERRGRADSRGSSRSGKSRADEKSSDLQAPTTTEVSLKLAQKAYIESRNRQWEDIKLKYNLKDADKSQHPMFALLTTGYLCEDCNVTCMDSYGYQQHLTSEGHVREIQLKAQEMLSKAVSSGLISKPGDDRQPRKSRFTDADEPSPIDTGNSVNTGNFGRDSHKDSSGRDYPLRDGSRDSNASRDRGRSPDNRPGDRITSRDRERSPRNLSTERSLNRDRSPRIRGRETNMSIDIDRSQGNRSWERGRSPDGERSPRYQNRDAIMSRDREMSPRNQNRDVIFNRDWSPRNQGRDGISNRDRDRSPRNQSRDAISNRDRSPRNQSRDAISNRDRSPRNQSRDGISNRDRDRSPRNQSRDGISNRDRDRSPRNQSRDAISKRDRDRSPRNQSRDGISNRDRDRSPRNQSRDAISKRDRSPRNQSRDGITSRDREKSPRNRSRDSNVSKSKEQSPRTQPSGGRSSREGNRSHNTDNRQENRNDSTEGQANTARRPKGVSVSAPDKPKGPLLVENIQATSCQLFWNRRKLRSDEKFHVEYSTGKSKKTQSPWYSLGITSGTNYVVRDLEEGVIYLFQVKTIRDDIESLPLLGTRIKTKISEATLKAREQKRQEKAAKMAEGQTPKKAEEETETSKDRDKETKSRDDHKDKERRSRDEHKDKETRSRDEQKVKETADKGKASSNKDRQTATGKDDKKTSQQEKLEFTVKAAKGRIEEMLKEGEKDRKDEKKKEEEKAKEKEAEDPRKRIEVFFYEKLKETNEKSPMLGLQYLTELQNYNPSLTCKYKCLLCNLTLTENTILAHIKGFAHKMKYFEKYDPKFYDQLTLIQGNKEKRVVMDKHAVDVAAKQPCAAINVQKMENPADHGGKIVYSDPVAMPAPGFETRKETSTTTEMNLEEDEGPKRLPNGEVIKLFDKLLQDEEVKLIKLGQKVDPVLGLQYVKELLHPQMTELPRYQCNLCKSNLAQTNILKHIWGRKHRLAYLKVKHTEVYDEIIQISQKKDMNEAIDIHSQEVEETIGRETVTSVKSKNAKLWDWAKKVFGDTEKAKAEKQGTTTATVETGTGKSDVFKFGVKAKEPVKTNVKQSNVLDQSPARRKPERDWSTENAELQERIKNQTIIKSTRLPKFNTVYQAFFKKFPVIGLQWVTEFQKPDKNEEPWYMCFLCQSRVPWKSILDHVTSVQHRLDYMKKSYNNMYNLLKSSLNEHTQSVRGNMRVKVEEYATKIARVEGEHTLEVMLELNFNRSLLSVAGKPLNKGKSEASSTTTVTGGQQADNTSTVTTTASVSETTGNVESMSIGTPAVQTADMGVEEMQFTSPQGDELYKAQLEAKAKLGELEQNTGTSDLYKAQLDAQAQLNNELNNEQLSSLMSDTELYKAQLEAKAKLAELEQNTGDLYKAQLDAQAQLNNEQLMSDKALLNVQLQAQAQLTGQASSVPTTGYHSQPLPPGVEYSESPASVSVFPNTAISPSAGLPAMSIPGQMIPRPLGPMIPRPLGPMIPRPPGPMLPPPGPMIPPPGQMFPPIPAPPFGPPMPIPPFGFGNRMMGPRMGPNIGSELPNQRFAEPRQSTEQGRGEFRGHLGARSENFDRGDHASHKDDRVDHFDKKGHQEMERDNDFNKSRGRHDDSEKMPYSQRDKHSDKRPFSVRDDIDKRPFSQRDNDHYDKRPFSQRDKEDSDRTPFSQRESYQGEKRRDRGSRSPDSYKRLRRDESYQRTRSRSPKRRHRSSSADRGHDKRLRGSYDDDSGRSDRFSGDRERTVSYKSSRDSHQERHGHSSSYDRELNTDHLTDFEERYNKQQDYDIDEFLRNEYPSQSKEPIKNDTDFETLEKQMFEADLILRKEHESRDSYERFGDNFDRRGRNDERRSRSPRQRSHYDDRREDQNYRSRSPDRFGDNREDKYGDDDSSRQTQARQKIDELLAQVNSKMSMMPEEDQLAMREELRRNLPQVSMEESERGEPDFSEREERPSGGRGMHRGRGSRQGFRGKGRGFAKRGR